MKDILGLAAWLFLVVVLLWIVLSWCGVASAPSVLLVLFSMVTYMVFHGIPARVSNPL